MTGADEIQLVERFLRAIGEGDLDAARALLAPGAHIEFPGGRRFAELEELKAAARQRYAWVDKCRDHYFAGTSDGAVRVVSTGRLFGENLHGVPFGGVRYVDIFQLADGLITHQWVWNDLAETGVLDARSSDELAPQWRPTG